MSFCFPFPTIFDRLFWHPAHIPLREHLAMSCRDSWQKETRQKARVSYLIRANKSTVVACHNWIWLTPRRRLLRRQLTEHHGVRIARYANLTIANAQFTGDFRNVFWQLPQSARLFELIAGKVEWRQHLKYSAFLLLQAQNDDFAMIRLEEFPDGS